jgi:hypothetical protein
MGKSKVIYTVMDTFIKAGKSFLSIVSTGIGTMLYQFKGVRNILVKAAYMGFAN